MIKALQFLIKMNKNIIISSENYVYMPSIWRSKMNISEKKKWTQYEHDFSTHYMNNEGGC